MIVTPGLLKAVEMFALHFPRSPVPFLPQVYVYRWQAILIQSVMWIILIAVVRVVAPATHRLFNNAVFVALMLTQTGGSCASLQKLPYANGIQTIERIKPRKQRILMHIGTSSDLEERIKIQVHGADKDRYFIGNKEVSTQEAARHIMAQSSLGPETETTKPILTTQNRKTGANLISANLRKIRDSGKKSLVIKQNKNHSLR